jgi:hypothetical protein
MVVGGVTSLIEPFNEQDRTRYANLLRSSIVEEREDFSVSPTAIVVNKLGKDRYHALLDGYRDTGGLSDDQLDILKSNVEGVSYFVFARVEADDVSRDMNISQRGKRVTKKISRDTTVAFDVYDIASKKVVWHGLIDTNLSDSNNYAIMKETVMVDLVKAAKGSKIQEEDEKRPYPETPTLKQAFDRIFKKFGAALPKK